MLRKCELHVIKGGIYRERGRGAARGVSEVKPKGSTMPIEELVDASSLTKSTEVGVGNVRDAETLRVCDEPHRMGETSSY